MRPHPIVKEGYVPDYSRKEGGKAWGETKRTVKRAKRIQRTRHSWEKTLRATQYTCFLGRFLNRPGRSSKGGRSKEGGGDIMK